MKNTSSTSPACPFFDLFTVWITVEITAFFSFWTHSSIWILATKKHKCTSSSVLKIGSSSWHNETSKVTDMPKIVLYGLFSEKSEKHQKYQRRWAILWSFTAQWKQDHCRNKTNWRPKFAYHLYFGSELRRNCIMFNPWSSKFQICTPVVFCIN